MVQDGKVFHREEEVIEYRSIYKKKIWKNAMPPKPKLSKAKREKII